MPLVDTRLPIGSTGIDVVPLPIERKTIGPGGLHDGNETPPHVMFSFRNSGHGFGLNGLDLRRRSD